MTDINHLPDIQKFFQATNPDRALFIDNIENDQKLYIDFSSVRGNQVIEELKHTITFFSPNEPTCQLFTGHIGCGKSTELRRLKAELEDEGFLVIYLDSFKDLEMSDVDVSDILLSILYHVSESLEENGIYLKPSYFQRVFSEMKEILLTPIKFDGVKLSVGIAEITAKAQASPKVRSQLREYLEPRTERILEEINKEVLRPGIRKLKERKKKGLVVIVDNLEKIDNVPKPWKRPQHEYLFIDRGLQLRSLECHLVYTMPLSLRFSNEYESLMQRFQIPKILPMVMVKLRDDTKYEQGLEKLRNMVLARAFPDFSEDIRLNKVLEIFDDAKTLDYLCQVSGGHVRILLRLLNTSIIKEMRLPITRRSLESVIVEYRSERTLAIDPKEWDLLRQVAKSKKFIGDEGYESLVRSMFVYEYRDSFGAWFDINPILAEAEELK